MSSELYFFSALIILLIFIIFWLLNRKLTEIKDKTENDKTLIEWLKSMQVSLDGTNKNMVAALQRSSRDLNERLDKAAKYIAQVSKEVGQMSEIGRSMKDLQDFLKSPKLRGNIGEEVLKDLLNQLFPKNTFHLQYTFKSGEKVDAAIKTAAGILPIDSKFPMENFQKMVKFENETQKKQARKDFINDVRKHIRDIARKYILPEEGTMDLALMYIPSEAVYYEIVNDPEITNFARQSRIYPVSPTTLYAHLQMILLSFEGQKIEARSRQVFQLLRAVQKDYEKTEEVLAILGRHLTNAYNQMVNVRQSFFLLGQKLNSSQTLAESEERKQLLAQESE